MATDGERVGNWMITRYGKFWPLDPRPEDVDLRDIAWALSMICRYGGHVLHFYSVAQHSVLVASILPTRLQKAGLLHDAAEAYIGDMVRPLKRSMPSFAHAECMVEQCVEERFGLRLTEQDRELVKAADEFVLTYEANQAHIVRDGRWARPYDLKSIDASVRWRARVLISTPLVPLSSTAARMLFEGTWSELETTDGE